MVENDIIEPTERSRLPDTAECVNDGNFGPVAALLPFTDEAEVIARANDTEYGLVAYVFTGDFRRGPRVCERPDYGMVGLTRTTTEPWWDGIAFRPVPMAPLDLSYDHRVVNGAEAARFLAAHAAMLADPRRMLV